MPSHKSNNQATSCWSSHSICLFFAAVNLASQHLDRIYLRLHIIRNNDLIFLIESIADKKVPPNSFWCPKEGAAICHTRLNLLSLQATGCQGRMIGPWLCPSACHWALAPSKDPAPHISASAHATPLLQPHWPGCSTSAAGLNLSAAAASLHAQSNHVALAYEARLVTSRQVLWAAPCILLLMIQSSIC